MVRFAVPCLFGLEGLVADEIRKLRSGGWDCRRYGWRTGGSPPGGRSEIWPG